MKTLIIFGILCWFTVTAQQNDTSLSKANNEFCFALLKQFSKPQNVFFSPFSTYIALGMLFAGAKGSTAEVMQRVLKYQHENATTNKTIHESLNNVINILNTASNEYKLSIANAFLYQQGYSVLPEFTDTLAVYYNALLKEVDAGDEEAVDEINNWVSNKTNNKIPKLFEELPSNTVTILLNAIYFKGTWEKKFNAEYTTNDTFYNYGVGRSAVTVPMMNTREAFLNGHFPDKGFKAIELPYKGGNLGMLIILPLEPDKLSVVEDNLNAEELNNVISRMHLSEVRVSIPKFDIKDSRELSSDLTRLGLGELFSHDADFSGINGHKDLFVSEVLHEAAIEVNEEGTEAAAVTGITSSRSFSPIFCATHPFLFFIREKTTNTILFGGRVTNL